MEFPDVQKEVLPTSPVSPMAVQEQKTVSQKISEMAAAVMDATVGRVLGKFISFVDPRDE